MRRPLILCIPGEVAQVVTKEVSKAADVAVNQIKNQVEQTITRVAQDITLQNQRNLVHQRTIAISALEAQNGPGIYLIAGCGCIILCMIIYVACLLRGMKGQLDCHEEPVEQILHIKNPMRSKGGEIPHTQMTNSLAPPPRGGGGGDTDCSMVDMDI